MDAIQGVHGDRDQTTKTSTRNMEKHQQATNIMNALLQPEDSKRVADQIIYMLEHADLDVASSASIAISRELHHLPEIIDNAIRRSIEGTLGSYEFGQIVDEAIRLGIQSRSDDVA